jgi:hypothetical protein
MPAAGLGCHAWGLAVGASLVEPYRPDAISPPQRQSPAHLASSDGGCRWLGNTFAFKCARAGRTHFRDGLGIAHSSLGLQRPWGSAGNTGRCDTWWGTIGWLNLTPGPTPRRVFTAFSSHRVTPSLAGSQPARGLTTNRASRHEHAHLSQSLRSEASGVSISNG